MHLGLLCGDEHGLWSPQYAGRNRRTLSDNGESSSPLSLSLYHDRHGCQTTIHTAHKHHTHYHGEYVCLQHNTHHRSCHSNMCAHFLCGGWNIYSSSLAHGLLADPPLPRRLLPQHAFLVALSPSRPFIRFCSEHPLYEQAL